MELNGALSNPFSAHKHLLNRAIHIFGPPVDSSSSTPKAASVIESRGNRVLESAALVLQRSGRPMTVGEIHAAACEFLGRELHPSSIKGALSANILGARPQFRRIRRGVYVLAAGRS